MREQGIGADAVVRDDVRERPLATRPRHRMAVAGNAGIKPPPDAQVFLRDGDRRGNAATRGLAEDAHAAVVVLIGAGRRVGIEDNPRSDACFAMGGEGLRHRGAEHVDLLREDRVYIRVIRVNKWRHEVAWAVGHHLVQVVDNMRVPDIVNLLHRQPVLYLRQHEPVAVVVVARVGLVNLRRRATFKRGVKRARVPVMDEIPAIRVERLARAAGSRYRGFAGSAGHRASRDHARGRGPSGSRRLPSRGSCRSRARRFSLR